MRVLVMGAGGVGGFYGGLLARHGHEVAFVARGAHLETLRARGLTIWDGGSEAVLDPVLAVADPREVGPGLELVLFTVKSYDTDPAAEALRPGLGRKAAVLTLQNGVDGVDRLAAILGADAVVAGVTTLESRIAAPGVIERTGPAPRLVLGELHGERTARLEAIAAAFRETGVQVVMTGDARRAIWEKFVRLAPGASLTTACEASIGAIRETPEGAALYRSLVSEAVAVGRASGVALPPDAVDAALAFIWSLPASMTTSMQRDYERRGRVELESLTGAVVRLGRARAVATPTFDVLYGILRVRALAFGGLGEER